MKYKVYTMDSDSNEMIAHGNSLNNIVGGIILLWQMGHCAPKAVTAEGKGLIWNDRSDLDFCALLEYEGVK